MCLHCQKVLIGLGNLLRLIGAFSQCEYVDANSIQLRVSTRNNAFIIIWFELVSDYLYIYIYSETDFIITEKQYRARP